MHGFIKSRLLAREDQEWKPLLQAANEMIEDEPWSSSSEADDEDEDDMFFDTGLVDDDGFYRELPVPEVYGVPLYTPEQIAECYSGKYYEEVTCILCREDFQMGDSIAVLQCGHGFHAECVDDFVCVGVTASRGPRCPMCSLPNMLEAVCIKIHDKEAPVEMTVFLKTTTNEKVFTFRVFDTDTVDSFKGRIAQKLELTTHEMRLQFQSKFMREGTLSDNGVENESMIMLLPTGVKGGAAKRKLEVPKVLTKNEDDPQQLCVMIDALANGMTQEDFAKRFRGFRAEGLAMWRSILTYWA
jgi:hypothetical protein